MRHFGKYNILRQLGKGGMGVVYEAELSGPGNFRKVVALKVLADATAAIDDLAREAALGGLLRHPNLVDTYEYGEVDGVAYIAMELVDGPSLAELLHGPPLPADAAIQIGQQIATGLAHAHGVKVEGRPLGLVHRDLKPANAMVSRFGVVKITDFGIATTHQEDERRSVGTPGYMSPEQWFGYAVDARSDLWSLGAILYRAVVGRPLLARGAGPMALHGSLASGVIEREVDEAAPGLGAIVQSCLEIDPDRRPSRAGDVKRALAQVPPTGAGDLASVLGRALEDIATSQLIGAAPFADTEARSVGRPTAPNPPDVDRDATTALLRFDNLGPEPDAFVAREQALANGRELLAAGARVLTFTGPGGIGKSRLALRLARGLPGAFPGGRLLVEVTGCRSMDDVCAALRGPMQLAPEADLHAIEHQLNRAGSLLVVLDGCDQLTDAVGPWVSGLLVRCPRVRFLATGVRRLGLPGEHVVEVAPLDPAGSAALFAARANGRSGPEVDALLDAVDHLPLAIEFAAERSRLVPPDRLLELVTNDALRVLRTARRGVPDRHRSIEACVRCGWDALTADARKAAAILATSGGPATWEELGGRLGGSDPTWALDAVDELVEWSFARLRHDGRAELPLLHATFVRAVAAAEFPGLPGVASPP